MIDKSMESLAVLSKELGDKIDVPQEMLKMVVEAIMSAQADAICGAAFGERSDDRVNQRNGYRHRDWDTRVGTIDLAIPKLRTGSYFPDWLLVHRRRTEKALAQVVAEAYVKGVSTRRIDGLVKSMGIDGMSKSQVSELAKELDEIVESFRTRPLDQGPYTYIWLDALFLKCRQGGRIVNVAQVTATGVNADGYREILGFDIFASEDGAAWTAFLRGLVARGLSGVKLVISDAHEGLRNAIAAVFSESCWQRCRTHFMRNVLSRVQRRHQDMVATIIRSIFGQPDLKTVKAQCRQVIDQLERLGFEQIAEMISEAEADILAFATFPKQHWKQIWSNNPQERLNKEIRRRTDVVGIFPTRPSIIRLVGAVLAEQNDEWAVTRRYMNPTLLAKARLVVIDGEQDLLEEEENGQQLAAGQ